MKKMTCLVLTAFICFIPLRGGLEINQSISTMPEAVSDYARELDAIRTGIHSGADIEKLLALGRKAADALISPKTPGAPSLLEGLSEESFQAVAHEMEGFWVNRQETLYVEPDPGFFFSLATKSGDRPSVEFFQAFGKTFQHGWPMYHQQQTDYGGCIRFGSMGLVDSYAMWTAYRENHPNRYAGEVQKIIRNLEYDLTEGTCACGGEEEVLQEYRAFVRVFPHSILAKRLRERMDQIKRGKSDIRWRCING